MATDEKTAELEGEFLDHVRLMVDYWAGEEPSNVPAEYGHRERLEGLAFSIMVALDGGASVGPYEVRPITEDGISASPDRSIAGALHERLGSGPWKRHVKPKTLLVAYDVSDMSEDEIEVLGGEAMVQAESSDNGVGHGDVTAMSFAIDRTLPEVYALVSD